MFTEERRWFQVAFQLKGSVVPSILGRTLFCGGVGALVAVLFQYRYPVSLPILASLIPNIVLGLLLVFRTNTAYERFWEGRKLWGALVNTTRNLARQIWIVIPARNTAERTAKVEMLHLLAAFAIAVKLHLRREAVNDELQGLLSAAKFRKLQTMNNPPLEIAFWISDFLQYQRQHHQVDSYQLTRMQDLLNGLVDVLGGCERILKTPMPMAYAIHLKQLLLLYCLSLPFQMVGQVGGWTGPIVALIAFTLFGIEEIGIEIENPFGHDPNDLPLDDICETMLVNIHDLMTLSPCTDEVYNEAGAAEAIAWDAGKC